MSLKYFDICNNLKDKTTIQFKENKKHCLLKLSNNQLLEPSDTANKDRGKSNFDFSSVQSLSPVQLRM